VYSLDARRSLSRSPFRGFVPVGVDKNGHPIAANSYDSCLAQLDDVYAREMQLEKELAKEE